MGYRVCAQFACPELLEHGRYCATHTPKKPKPYRSPESTQRQKAYKTQRWRTFSEQYRRAHPYCVVCGAPSQHVDHLDGEGPTGPLGYEDTNLQALCASCHARKTAHADGSFGRPRLTR